MPAVHTVTWSDPRDAHVKLSPFFDSAGGIDNVLVQLTDEPGANGAPHAQCTGVLNIGRYVPARYAVDAAGGDVWLTTEIEPRQLHGVTGWILAE